MITITRRIEFDAGHRVLGHEGKCKHLHGHRYRVEITVRGPKLDALGRVIDFGEVKRLVGGWVDANWDHNLLLHPDDPLLATHPDLAEHIHGRAPYVMLPHGRKLNPTAENMAETLFSVACMLLGERGLEVIHVRLYETPNSWADYTPNTDAR